MSLRNVLRRLTWAAGGVATAKLLLGISVPLPDAQVLTAYVERGGAPLLELYNFLGGGALAKGSAFALGIMPYLSARLFMLLAPPLDADRKKWWTRGLTVGLSLVQSAGYAKFTQSLPGAVSHPGVVYTAEMMVMLTSVSTLLMLFAEEATSADDEVKAPPLFPLPSGDSCTGQNDGHVRDPLYVSHSTPLP